VLMNHNLIFHPYHLEVIERIHDLGDIERIPPFYLEVRGLCIHEIYDLPFHCRIISIISCIEV